MIRMPTDADLEYTRFGLAPGQIEGQTWLDPVSGVRVMGRPPGMMVVRLEIDSSTARSSYIGARCVEMVRSQSWFILEWDRLNPEMLRFFFVRMIRDTGFRLFYKNLNDSMRLCHLRIFDVLAPKVCKVALELNQAVLKTLTKERSVLKRSGWKTHLICFVLVYI